MKNKSIKQLFFLALVIIFANGLTGCKKDEAEKTSTLEQLYKTYKNGAIDECKYNGQTVYCAGMNVFDGGSIVYDMEGKQIGTCNFAMGQPDAICAQLSECETIYRVENNIWGLPATDKYKLGK